ncbi:MAG: hypothetical protein K6T83_07385 [Alicyclobacillus sp.]|nr:hypothetical protein [Alicyclobacillus sp.]
MLSVQGTIQWAEHTGYLPVRQSALTNKAWFAYVKKHPIQSVSPTEMKNAYFSPRVATMGSGITEVDTQVANMLTSQRLRFWPTQRG